MFSPRLSFLLAALAITMASATSVAAPVTIDGTVYVDENRNGVRDAGEAGVAGVWVWLDTGVSVIAGADGHYSLSAAADGLVWVRIPDGFEPTPVWKAVAVKDGARTIDLGLRRSSASGNVTFVHASDAHLNYGVSMEDAHHAFELANAVEPRPHFLVVTGDVSTDSVESTYDSLDQVMGGLTVPFVPVIGNHDLYDGGANYRRVLGPGDYCFDQGGMRFVVVNWIEFDNPTPLLAFIDKCTADRGALKVAVFTHMPLDDSTAATLAAHDVDYLFTGHWHSNRIIEHGALEEVNTQAFLMGGIDFTPAGYRIARFDGERFHYQQHTIVDATVLGVMWPPATGCVAPGALEVIVAAEAGTTLGPVTVTLDGGAAVATTERGGWDRTAQLTVGDGKDHTLVATAPGGATVTRSFCVAAPAAAPKLADWTQLQGSAAHMGTVPQRIEPPLVELWAHAVGGPLHGGSVVVGDGRLFAPVDDLADGTAGGVVALDATSGALLWEKRLGYAVHNAPAVVGGLVIAGTANGVVHALHVETGDEAWTFDLGGGMSQNYSWLYAAPSVADGVVYIAVERHLAALDAATGRELWSVDPSPQSYWLGSYAAVGVGGGVVVAAVSRGVDGIVAYDALDGHELWQVAPLANAINAGIIVDGDQVFIANGETNVFAMDLVAPPAPRYAAWEKQLQDDAGPWSYGVFGTPALTSDRMIVPTMFGDVVALDRPTGTELWRHSGAPATVWPVHYRAAGEAAYASAPVVTGDLVWVGGVDGRLSALKLETGSESFGLDLGAPIFSAPVPSGDVLYVGTFDGTVHAFAHAADATCPGAPGCTPPSPGGCVVAGPGRDLVWVDALWVLAAVVLRRRRRPS